MGEQARAHVHAIPTVMDKEKYHRVRVHVGRNEGSEGMHGRLYSGRKCA